MDIDPQPDSKTDCLHEVEEALNISIPISLKNILKINACNNAAILCDIAEKDLEEMELFMASQTARDLIPKSEYEQYYGVFHTNPEKFKFLLGHRKLLLLISKYFKDKIQKNEPKGVAEFEPGQNCVSKTETRSLARSGPSTSSTSSDSNLSLKQAPNLTNENKQVSLTIKNWFKGKCTKDDLWHYFKEKFSQISFETKLNIRGELCCIITCYCKSKYQIMKSAQKVNYSQRWVYGNIHRHLTKHLNEHLNPQLQSKNVSEVAQEAGKNSVPSSEPNVLSASWTTGLSIENNGSTMKQQGIKKFFTPNSRPCSSQSLTQSNLRSNRNLDHSEPERDWMGDISEHEIPVQSTVQNQCESRCGVSNNVEIMSLPPNETSDHIPYTQEDVGSTKINIFSNQILVHAKNNVSTRDEIVHEVPSDSDNLHPQRALISNITSKSRSKWTLEKYQRNQRARRKRENLGENDVSNQTVITSFLPFLSRVENEVESIMHNALGDKTGLEYSTLSTKLNDTLKALPPKISQIHGEPSASHRSQFLKMLIDISIQNSDSSSSRYHYNDVVKKFSIYLFYIGGRLLYETIYENMKGVLPSISTLNNYVAKSGGKIEEGVFDYDGLCTFLEERNLPKVVWISEDGTRVTGKIEYDSKSNKLVGFTLPLVDGLPQTDTFLATSAKAIQNCFLTSCKSNYAYTVMAQPLSNSAPPYCLVVFGTDNRFDSNDVSKRWKHIKDNLEMRGIILLGFSSDGDTRLLKAMRQHASLPPALQLQTNGSKYPYKWYQAGYNRNNFPTGSYVQDTVHIGTKLRTRFLNPKATLTMGTYTAVPAHIEELISKFSKDKHLLTASDLKGEDKMCFKSVEKMCSESVIQLLESIPGSEGTRAYLRVMQFAISSYLDPGLDVQDRLYKIWFCVFFLRIWRKWLADQPSLKIGDSFITSNCYLCIELNAHALINICNNFRENPNLTNDMFLPHLFSSQACEKTFRATRSMTTTYSTVVNYSIKDIIRRMDRIATLSNTINDLQGLVSFPREEKKNNKRDKHFA